jgi:hypothetical protein
MIAPLFTAINECQALHPDPSSEQEDDEDDDEEEEGGEYDEAEEDAMNGHTNGHHVNGNDEHEEGVEEEVRLTERGRQILRRLNINHTENEEADGSAEPSDAQFEDAM